MQIGNLHPPYFREHLPETWGGTSEGFSASPLTRLLAFDDSVVLELPRALLQQH